MVAKGCIDSEVFLIFTAQLYILTRGKHNTVPSPHFRWVVNVQNLGANVFLTRHNARENLVFFLGFGPFSPGIGF